MARVTNVKSARKDQGQCSHPGCGTVITKGMPYRHASPGFRARKRVKCVEHPFRPSELTTAKIGTFYAARESFEDTYSSDMSVEDVVGLFEDIASAIEEMADEYEEAAEAMGDAGYSYQERADALREVAQRCNDAESEIEHEDPECEDCDGDGWTEEEESCDECDGTGYVEDDEAEDEVPCDTCDGDGYSMEQVQCDTCDGSGENPEAGMDPDAVDQFMDDIASEVEEAVSQ